MAFAALERLAGVAPFSALEAPAIGSIVDRLEKQEVRDGDVVVREGDDGSCMFVIARGTFRVQRAAAGEGGPKVVTDLGEGEFFGEMSLLSGAPRFATVIAVGPGELQHLGRADLDAIVALHPRVGEVLGRFYKERLVANVLRASRLFRLIAEGRTKTLADVVRVETHPAGTLLLEQGQPAKGFYLLLRGTCDVFHLTEDARELPYPSMEEGDVFGELSLLQGGAITANVRTHTRCVVLALGPEWFDELLLAPPSVRSEIYQLAGERSQRTRELLIREELERRLI